LSKHILVRLMQKLMAVSSPWPALAQLQQRFSSTTDTQVAGRVVVAVSSSRQGLHKGSKAFHSKRTLMLSNAHKWLPNMLQTEIPENSLRSTLPHVNDAVVSASLSKFSEEGGYVKTPKRLCQSVLCSSRDNLLHPYIVGPWYLRV
jgi:hypothetical protein